MGSFVCVERPALVAPTVADEIFCNGLHAVELTGNACARFLLYRDASPVLNEAAPGERIHRVTLIIPLPAIWPAMTLTSTSLGRELLMTACDGIAKLC